MKNIIDIFSTMKKGIVEQTLALMPIALSGDKANVSFFVDSNGKVDYHYHAGQIVFDVTIFFTIQDYEYPDPEDYGYLTLAEMDFQLYGECIFAKIEDHIFSLESAI